MTTITAINGGYRYRCERCGWEKVHPRLVKMNCRECRLRAAYPDSRDALKMLPPEDDPRRRLVEPSLARKARNFARASTQHALAGFPEATDDQVASRFATCQACEIFKPTTDGQGVCTHSTCGCSLKTVGLTGRNKLRWADQACPLGKWAAVEAKPAAE